MDLETAELPIRSVDDNTNATDSDPDEENDSIDVRQPSIQDQINDTQIHAENVEFEDHMSRKETPDDAEQIIKKRERSLDGTHPEASRGQYNRHDAATLGLACPYAKSDPETYMNIDACRPTEGFKEPRLLFEHIWRKHTRFYQCGFCSTRWSISTPRGEVKQKKEKHWKSCDGKLRGVLYIDGADEGSAELMDWKQQELFEKTKSIRDVRAKIEAVYKACGKPIPKTYYANEPLEGHPLSTTSVLPMSEETSPSNLDWDFPSMLQSSIINSSTDGHFLGQNVLESLAQPIPDNHEYRFQHTTKSSREASPTPSINRSDIMEPTASTPPMPFNQPISKAEYVPQVGVPIRNNADGILTGFAPPSIVPRPPRKRTTVDDVSQPIAASQVRDSSQVSGLNRAPDEDSGYASMPKDKRDTDDTMYAGRLPAQPGTYWPHNTHDSRSYGLRGDHVVTASLGHIAPENHDYIFEDAQSSSSESSSAKSATGSPVIQPASSISSMPFSQRKSKTELDQSGEPDLGLLSVVSEDIETATIYSEESTGMARSGVEEFEFELGRDLCDRLSSCPGAEDSFSRDVLPSRLAEFARRFAAEGSPQIYRDIMVFVHKHRRGIASRFQEVAIDEARYHTEAIAYIPKVESWLDHAASGGENELVHPEETWDGVAEEDEDDDSTISPAEMEAYRRVITGSNSYDWLISKLRCDLSFCIPGEADAREQMSNPIHSHPALRHVSRRAPQPVFKAVYIADWDPVGFLQSQDYEKHPSEALWDALTLTGTANEAEGLACGDYICRTWPHCGTKFLELLESIIQPGLNPEREVTLPDKTQLSVSMQGANVEVQVSGVADTVAEIGEQFAWICCALNSYSSANTVRCTPEGILLDSGLSPPSVRVKISRKVHEITSSGDQNGSCWKHLFRNPVLVEGFPIQRRPAPGTGLELPLATMAELVQCERMTVFNDQIFLKGFCAMLVAVQMVGDVVQWHAYTNEDGSYMNYYGHREAKETADLELLSHIQNFMSMRHVVGWTSSVRDNSGSANANYVIQGSGLRHPPGLQLAFDRLNLGFSKYVTANISVALGTRDKPPQVRGRVPYFEQVRLVATKLVILFDAKDRKAWLLDGATALAHLLRASLVLDAKNGIELINSHESLQWPEAKPGEIRALKMLSHEGNVDLKLWKNPNDEDMKIETRRPEFRQAGRPSRETGTTETTRQTWYRIKDRVSLIFSVLEELFNHQEDCRPTGVGFRIITSPRKHLEGFDFLDVANGTGQIFPRAVRLEPHGCGWVDLARELRAITLFGRGFGELLQPTQLSTHDPDCMGNGTHGVCSRWQALPKGMDYLATSNSTLQRILDTHGDMEQNPWCIINEIYLHSPDEVFGRCRCAGHGCDRVQVPLPDSFRRKRPWRCFRSPLELPPDGAVIFGHNTKYPLKWGDTGDPLLGDIVESPETPSDPSTSSLTPTSASSVGGSVASPPSAVTPTSSETVSNGGVGSFIAVLRRKRRRGST